jgi:hypothetical protein
LVGVGHARAAEVSRRSAPRPCDCQVSRVTVGKNRFTARHHPRAEAAEFNGAIALIGGWRRPFVRLRSSVLGKVKGNAGQVAGPARGVDVAFIVISGAAPFLQMTR